MAEKYVAYAEYKDSGVEWLEKVPSHWQPVPIKYLASEKDTLFLDGDWIESKDISDSGIRYITTGNVGEGQYKEQGTGFISDQVFQKLNCSEVFEQDILISRLNLPIGRACIVPNLNNRIVTSVDNVILRPDIIYCKRFLVHLFSSSEYFHNTANLARGATMQRISRGLLGNIRISLPEKEEQVQIANFLDFETAQIDTLINKQQTLIQLLKEKRQAVISHAVTKGLNPDAPMKDSGVEWLGEVPEHWEVPKLIHQTLKIGDGLHSTPQYHDNTGYYFVNGNNLVNGQIIVGTTSKEVPEDEYKKHYIYLDKSSVLLSINGTIGNVARYNNEKVILGKSAAYMNCADSLLPEYLMLYLQSSQAHYYFNLEATGTTIFNLSLNSIRQMRVCVPSMQEQSIINEYCNLQQSKYNILIKKVNTAIQLMQERRTALISAAVTGKIDVRGWVAPDAVL